MDGNRLLLHHFRFGGDEQHVVFLQRNVGSLTAHDPLHVDGHHLQRSVRAHAMHHGMCRKSLFGKALGMFYQRANAINRSSHLIDARAEHSPFHLDAVGKTRQNGVDAHRVFVGEMERVEVELADVVHREFPSRLSHQPYRLRISIARKATGIFQQGTHALAAFHFVVHRPLHLTGDVDNAVVSPNDNHVVVSQAHIARELPVEDIVVDVHHGDEFVAPIHLDVAQRTQTIDAAGHIQSVKHRCKSRERIGAGQLHLAHYIHQDRTRLPHGKAHARTAVTCP